MARPPKAYTTFIDRFPGLGTAWEAIHEAGAQGPLDARTQRLVKLAVAAGALREGPVRASVRKAAAMGITLEEMEQVVALAAGTLGLPSCVAIHGWIHEALEPREERHPD